ncbi:Sec-independent protein translocase protein TatB [Ningiella sp. W23]|uniref:Sec-independent protein translocase protein TatB n=1 Tax=Ningiella sp. W23 TaxID=3023715 RepID=UPI00375671C4
MPFDIGFIELCVLMVVALMLLGPDKLTVTARFLSKFSRRVSYKVNSLKSEISRELEMDELRKQLESQNKQMSEAIEQKRNLKGNMKKL